MRKWIALLPLIVLAVNADAQLQMAGPPAISATAEIPAPASRIANVTVKGRRITYRVLAEETPLTDSSGTVIATVFSASYIAQGQRNAVARPVMFLFNGGPGSAAVGVHPAIGPRRFVSAPPQLGGDTVGITVANDNTSLDVTDLVFLDPVGTGYARRMTEAGTRFWGVVNDARATADFITGWLQRNNRTASPVIIAGESYGGIRMVLAARFLADARPKVVSVRGLLMISPSTSQPIGTPSDGFLTSVNALPTYAAVAHFHKKGAFGNLTLEEVSRRAERFAENEYRDALVQWDSLSAGQRDSAAARVAEFVGLAKADLVAKSLRISAREFRLGLLASTDEQIGTDDGRTRGFNEVVNKLPPPYNEPGSSKYRLKYDWPAAWDRYYRTEIGYKPTGPYYTFANVRPWNSTVPAELTGTARMLAALVADNPSLRILLTLGYFDLTIPYRSPLKALRAAGLPSEVIQVKVYPVGHVVHADLDAAPITSEDIREFVRRATQGR